ncbi:MAG: TRL domain-containing protein [Planctomycetota bacterium]
MKSFALALCVLSIACFVTGCVMPMTTPVHAGLITMNVKGPAAGVDNSVACSKVGEATAQGIICFAQGDASIKAAMDAGGIKKVHHVDTETFSVLGVYTQVKTIVYGE